MKRSPLILPIVILFVASAVALGSIGASRAAKNGCPSINSATGADHASENSAHGAAKQDERNCTPELPSPAETPGPTPAPTAEPTQAPTPDPTPTEAPQPTPSPTPDATPVPEPTPTATPAASPEPTPGDTPTPEPTTEPTATPVPTVDIEVMTLAFLTPPTAASRIPFQVTAQATIRNNAASTPAIVDVTFTPSLPAGCSATTGIITVQNLLLPAGASTFLSRSWMVTCADPGLKTIDMNVSAALDPLLPAVDDNPANNTGFASGNVQVN